MARRDLAAVPDRARLELEFDQPYLLGPLFGDYDRHLITIEQSGRRRRTGRGGARTSRDRPAWPRPCHCAASCLS